MDIILASSVTTWQVTMPVDVPPQKVFRNIINLQFETGAHADAIRIDTQQTTLEGFFVPKQYNTLDNDSPIQATLQSAPDNTIIITLDAPRRINKIKINSIQYSDYLSVVAALEKGTFNHRYNLPAYQNLSAAGAQPSTGEHLQVSVDTIKAEAEAAYRLGERWSVDVEKIELYRVDGEAIAEEPTFTVDNNQEIEDFIATKFAVKAIDESQTYADLETHHLADIVIQSNPTGPRIGVAVPVDEGEVHNIIEYFWNVPGEIAEQANTVPVDKNPVEELAKALGRYLKNCFDQYFDIADEQKNPPEIPEKIGLDLVFESDAPCDFQASQFEIDYVLVRQQSSFPYLEEGGMQSKSVVRFDGQTLQTEPVVIELPANSDVVSARLKTESSVGGEPSYIMGEGMEVLSESNRSGINIAGDRWVAQQVMPEKAVSVNAFAVALMNLERETELLVEFQEDWNGQPSGKKLAEAKIRLAKLGERVWSKINLKDSITLATQAYWILMKSAKGSALWFTRTGEYAPVQVLQAGNAPAALAKISAITGVQTYYVMYSCCPQGDQTQPLFSLSIGNTRVSPLAMQKETVSYDLKDTLKDVLENPLTVANEAGLVPVTINFSSAYSGLITIQPPIIEYDLLS